MQNSTHTTKQYDYSAFSRRITPSDVIETARGNTSKPLFISVIVIILIVQTILLVSLPSIFTYTAKSGDLFTNNENVFGIAIACFILLFFVMAVMVAIRKWVVATRQRVHLKTFALANGFTFLQSSHINADDYKGLIFNQGHSKEIEYGIQSTDLRYEFANYSYITSTGKDSTTHRTGFVRMKLPRRMPHMVLDATSNNLFKRFSNLPETFTSNQKLSLEGDFDKYFTLYAPAEYKTDALYVFTPDIMQLFIVNAHTFDAEVIDDDLYLYTSCSLKLDNAESLQALFELVDKIYPKLHNQTDYYSDERIGNRVANIVAPAGSRLKSRFSYVVVAFFIFVFLVQILPSIIRMFFN